jgi:hypothetical protein
MLPFDIERCAGLAHKSCQYCRRREPGDPERQWQVAPAIDLETGYCRNFFKGQSIEERIRPVYVLEAEVVSFK